MKQIQPMTILAAPAAVNASAISAAPHRTQTKYRQKGDPHDDFQN